MHNLIIMLINWIFEIVLKVFLITNNFNYD